MKFTKKLMALLLVGVMLCTSACGMKADYTIDEKGNEILTSGHMYFTEEEMNSVKESLESLYSVDGDESAAEEAVAELMKSFTSEELDGTTYYAYDLADESTPTTVEENGGYFTSSTYEMPSDTFDGEGTFSSYTSMLGDSTEEEDLLDAFTFADYTITFPYQVKAANGEIQEDGYTVKYDLASMMKADPDAGYRLYAAFTDKAVNDTGIYIAGAADGKTYNYDTTVTVYTNGTVTDLKVDGKSISGRSVTLTDNKEHTMYVKLLSGAEKTITFTMQHLYDIDFNVNGGKELNESYIEVLYGEKYGTLPTPTRTGYKFAGWYTKKSGGTKVTASTVCKKDTTLYAHWTAKSYKLTYKVNGGKALKTSYKTVKYGSKYGTLKTPARSGYKFLGWYTKKSGGTKVTASTVCKGSKTVYAHWKKK